MKKLLTIILILGLLFPSHPASAATSCTKIKSQVLAIETKISAGLKEMKSRPSFTYLWFETVYTNYYIQRGSAEEARDEKIQEEGNRLLASLWKLGTNNPKCFTNTQKIRLKDPKFKYWRYSHYVGSDINWRGPSYVPNTTYLSDLNWLEGHWVYRLDNYKSIYKY